MYSYDHQASEHDFELIEIYKRFRCCSSHRFFAERDGIAAIAGKAASAGILDLLYFTGMLSMSLGILNLLSLPALDGGQMLLLGIEAVKRKPLSISTCQAIDAVGFALFILLTLIVTYRDIIELTA